MGFQPVAPCLVTQQPQTEQQHPTCIESRMPTNKPKAPARKPLWIIAGLALVMMIVSSAALAKRINKFNENRDAPLYAYIDIQNTDFDIFDHHFTIEEVTIDDRPHLKVVFATDELLIPVSIPPLHQLPTLFDRQHEWMSMMIMADRSGMSLEELNLKINSGEIIPRLIIATRTPFGAEPTKDKNHESIETEKNWGWGESQRSRWLFDFYEMNPDGTITAHQPQRFPESGKSLLTRQNYAKLKGEPIPQRDPGEIVEYSWQYGAALKVMPRAPAITFENQALRAAGWTLPTAAASILILIAATFFAIAPPRTTN